VSATERKEEVREATPSRWLCARPFLLPCLTCTSSHTCTMCIREEREDLFPTRGVSLLFLLTLRLQLFAFALLPFLYSETSGCRPASRGEWGLLARWMSCSLGENRVTFQVEAETAHGQTVMLIGESPSLGASTINRVPSLCMCESRVV
jgi:hypothetical protein